MNIKKHEFIGIEEPRVKMSFASLLLKSEDLETDRVQVVLGEMYKEYVDSKVALEYKNIQFLFNPMLSENQMVLINGDLNIDEIINHG